jgi:predicted transposase/invertase (TIGR01784 family)
MNDSRPLISFDWAIKRLLRQKANYGILEGFLSELLKQDILITQILESESNSEEEDDKYNQVDILCENEKSELFLIELQYTSEYDYFHRILYGASKLITERMKEGFKYEQVKKIYSINIVYFELGQGLDYIYHGKTEFRGMHSNDILKMTQQQQSKFNFQEVYKIYPEYYIIKVNKFDDIAKDTMDEWVYYLKHNELPENYRAKGLDQVSTVLKKDNMTPQEKRNYDAHQKSMAISYGVIETALMDGEAIGIKKEKKKQEKLREKERIVQENKDKTTIQNLYKAGMNATQIAGVMNVSVEEVERLIKM